MSEHATAAVDAGRDCDIADAAVVGKRVGDGMDVTVIGDDSTVRAGTVVYTDVVVGDRFVTGHNAVVRGGTRAGDDVLVGTNAVLDGDLTLGSRVSLQTGAYLPPETVVGDDVFVGPHAVVTNDQYPVRDGSELEGAVIESNVSIGANATVLPGVTVGENAFIAAGSLVDRDVPPRTLAIGTPVEFRDLPDPLRGGNELA